jgi:hypothetical protein
LLTHLTILLRLSRLSTPARAPVCTGLHRSLLFYLFHDDRRRPKLDSCIPGTSLKGGPGDTNAHLHVLSYLSGPFHLPTSFPPNRQIPTFNEPAQKFFFQFHLSTQNMATLQHLPVISVGLSTNLCLVILAVCTFLFSRWISARRLNLPPGPTSVPFIGNLHQISFHNQELCFAQWGRIFGTVLFPSPLIRHVQQFDRMNEQATLCTLESLDVPWSCSIP